ncbi:MAG: hypothetical protein CL916_12295 [Deltaproteobacteria bacterium]|nr:hypothetical protein [Deltaproteobacteria bacterium]
MILFILACGSDQNLDVWTWGEEHPTTEYSYEDLQKPLALIPYQGGMLVSDESLQSIVFLQDGEQTIVAETLPSPSEIIIHNDSVYFTTESTIEQLFVEDNSSTTIIDGLVSPKRIIMHNELLFWIEEGSLYYWDDGQFLAICSELSTPYDIIEWKDSLWITTQGDNGLWNLENDECTLMETLDDIPHRMTVDDDTLWITTRSFRWPYGGWIVSYDGETTKHIESPPEPEHITTWNGHVIWSSKQSITSYEQIPYSMLAAQTTVGDMLIHDDVLYWSDLHGGRIGSIILAEQ